MNHPIQSCILEAVRIPFYSAVDDIHPSTSFFFCDVYQHVILHTHPDPKGVWALDDHTPIQTSLKMRSIADMTPEDGLTLSQLIELLKQDGLLITIMVLTTPFLLPVTIPGLSTPLGAIIILLCIGLMFNKTIRLPRKLGDRKLKQQHIRTITLFAAKTLAKIEKWTKPERLHSVLRRSINMSFNLPGIILNALCLFLPLPLFLSNFFPAYGILFIAFGILRRDGLLVLIGHGLLIVSIVYFSVAGYYATYFANLGIRWMF